MSYSLLTPCQETARPVATAARATLAPAAAECVGDGTDKSVIDDGDTPEFSDGNSPDEVKTVPAPDAAHTDRPATARPAPVPKKPKTRQDGLRFIFSQPWVDLDRFHV